MTRPRGDDPAFAHRSRRDGYGYHAIEDPCFDAHPPTQAELEEFWTDEYIPLSERSYVTDVIDWFEEFIRSQTPTPIGHRIRTADGAIREWTGEGWIRVGSWDPTLPLPAISEDHIERGAE